MNETNDLMLPCKGGICDFALDAKNENTFCMSGGGSCLYGDLLEAEASDFHDSTLVEATAKIRKILSEIPEDADGRKLSFFVTRMGILLAWSSHGEEVPANVITAKDSNEVLTQALKLTNKC